MIAPGALLLALLAATGAPSGEPAAELRIANRTVATFRATFAGNPPDLRARLARQRIAELRPTEQDAPVTTQPVAVGGEHGFAILVGHKLAFFLGEADRDPLEDPPLDQLAAGGAQRLGEALHAWHEQRSWPVVLRGMWQSAVATTVLLLLLWVVRRLRRAARALVARLEAQRAWLVAGRVDVAPVLAAAARGAVFALFWSGVALLLDVWATFVLGRFPVTAPWSDALANRVLGIFAAVGLSFLRALPGLAAVAVIVLIARFVARFLEGLLDRVERGTLTLPGLYPETTPATRRIVSALVWLVALAAAYPYIPGSDSDAVKGLSVVVGLMVSLGSTGLVSQAMSGLALVYSRALAPGDVVRIGDVEGVVSELGFLSTKVVTLPGQEVTIPNAVVLNGAVRNYTRQAPQLGPQVTTSATIGYDAPWRQVHALLLGAAAQTAGLVQDPPPAVLQRSLGDFYVEYQLLARMAADLDPRERPRIVSELHARVQDAFNAAGVQIMSPHFVLQPREPVVVPPERWDPAAPPLDAQRKG